MPTLSSIGRSARTKTSKKFAEELAGLTTLTTAEAKKLFPRKADRVELAKLIKIVNSSASDMEKKAELIEKIEDVSGAVLKIAGKFLVGI